MKRLRIYKIIIILSGLLIFGQNSYGQSVERRYLIWYSPSRATHVYGLMINFFFEDASFTKVRNGYPKICGAEVSLNPVGLISPFALLFKSFDPSFNRPQRSGNIPKYETSKKINGLLVATVNLEPTAINGLEINATGSFNTKTNGVTLSLVMNKNYLINGLTFAPIANHDVECNGIQIGLYNSSRRLKGLQIGLWNVNQKRKLPLINCAFKK